MRSMRAPIPGPGTSILSEVSLSPSCRFIDSFGFEWQAHEVAVPRPAPQQEKRALYFFSRGATRVLTDFPGDWPELTWAELEDLCARGRAVHRDGVVDVHPQFAPRERAGGAR